MTISLIHPENSPRLYNMEAIFACDKNGGIGFENSLPWAFNKEDMQHFVNVTRGKAVVMGSKTFESLGRKQLPNRRNIVLSRTPEKWDGVVESMTLEHFLSLQCFQESHIVIIGGAEIYEELLPLCDTLWVTRFHEEYECDTTMDMDWVGGLYDIKTTTLENNDFRVHKYENW